MTCVLIKVYGGIVDDVIFFDNEHLAINKLADCVKEMDPEDVDAWVFNPYGMIANAKTFLGEDDEFIDGVKNSIPETANDPLYIIGNPYHRLGFMVASPDDPLAYKNPVEALSELGQMRKDFGKHLKLYRLVPVAEAMAEKKDLEQHNAKCDIDDFDYSLVWEYLSPAN